MQSWRFLNFALFTLWMGEGMIQFDSDYFGGRWMCPLGESFVSCVRLWVVWILLIGWWGMCRAEREMEYSWRAKCAEEENTWDT